MRERNPGLHGVWVPVDLVDRWSRPNHPSCPDLSHLADAQMSRETAS
jgi:hypothetical protein